jgi:hypothetical protein
MWAKKIVSVSCLLNGKTRTCGNCSFGWYEFIGDIVIGHFENNTIFKIDRADYDTISEYRWWDDGHGYIVTSDDGRTRFLHNYILPKKHGYFCDHINRDKTDNRRQNLRYATNAENARNRGLYSNNSSGYIGVIRHKNNNKYRALLECNGKSINIGQYATAEEAARARDKAALYYFGDFAVLNFPELEQIYGQHI